MHRNQSVSAHSFAMVTRADIPRSRFNVQTSHKTTFDAGKLIPIYVVGRNNQRSEGRFFWFFFMCLIAAGVGIVTGKQIGRAHV